MASWDCFAPEQFNTCMLHTARDWMIWRHNWIEGGRGSFGAVLMLLCLHVSSNFLLLWLLLLSNFWVARGLWPLVTHCMGYIPQTTYHMTCVPPTPTCQCPTAMPCFPHSPLPHSPMLCSVGSPYPLPLCCTGSHGSGHATQTHKQRWGRQCKLEVGGGALREDHCRERHPDWKPERPQLNFRGLPVGHPWVLQNWVGWIKNGYICMCLSVDFFFLIQSNLLCSSLVIL